MSEKHILYVCKITTPAASVKIEMKMTTRIQSGAGNLGWESHFNAWISSEAFILRLVSFNTRTSGTREATTRQTDLCHAIGLWLWETSVKTKHSVLNKMLLKFNVLHDNLH